MLYPKLFHIYGPLYINSYGVAVALGLLLFVWLTSRDKRLAKYLNNEQFQSLFLLGIVSGVIGGRLLYIFNNWHELEHWYNAIAIWHGGLSITGTIVGALAATLGFLWYHTIPVLCVTDRLAIYAPLAQAIGRIGCFIAGCCHGTVSHSVWAVTYTNHHSFAPLYIPLQPTQLYSATALFLIFIMLYIIGHRIRISPGRVTALYFILIGFERFIIDFWRGDRLFFANDFTQLSVHQWLSGGIVMLSIVFYLVNNAINRSANPSILFSAAWHRKNTQGER